MECHHFLAYRVEFCMVICVKWINYNKNQNADRYTKFKIMLHAHLRDSHDCTVLFHLQENSCRSTSCLAKKLRVARSTIHERIIKLEHKEVTLDYTPTLKQESTEVQTLLFTQVESDCTGRWKDSCTSTQKFETASLLQESLAFLSLISPLFDNLNAFVEEVAPIPYILRTHSKIYLANKFERMSRRVDAADTFF